jgi:hypothetical protein
MILDLSAMLSSTFFSTPLIGFGFSREGKKNGAFSGCLGGSFGLLRCLIASRWRRFCHLLFGTKLSVIMSSLN